MAEVRFYHLTRQPLEEVLPVILERTLGRGRRAVVMARSPERVEALCAHLWTYDERAFLPHGSKADGFAAEQPIWLTTADENPNGAASLFLTDGAQSGRVAEYELVCALFDGNDAEAVAAARTLWGEYKEAGHGLTYWQQEPSGRWAQKAGG